MHSKHPSSGSLTETLLQILLSLNKLGSVVFSSHQMPQKSMAWLYQWVEELRGQGNLNISNAKGTGKLLHYFALDVILNHNYKE